MLWEMLKFKEIKLKNDNTKTQNDLAVAKILLKNANAQMQQALQEKDFVAAAAANQLQQQASAQLEKAAEHQKGQLNASMKIGDKRKKVQTKMIDMFGKKPPS